jgi:hypothetical protein
MGAHRHRGPRWNTSIENPDPIVLEKDRVEPRAAIMASRSSGHGHEPGVSLTLKDEPFG